LETHSIGKPFNGLKGVGQKRGGGIALFGLGEG